MRKINPGNIPATLVRPGSGNTLTTAQLANRARNLAANNPDRPFPAQLAPTPAQSALQRAKKNPGQPVYDPATGTKIRYNPSTGKFRVVNPSTGARYSVPGSAAGLSTTQWVLIGGAAAAGLYFLNKK